MACAPPHRLAWPVGTSSRWWEPTSPRRRMRTARPSRSTMLSQQCAFYARVQLSRVIRRPYALSRNATPADDTLIFHRRVWSASQLEAWPSEAWLIPAFRTRGDEVVVGRLQRANSDRRVRTALSIHQHGNASPWNLSVIDPGPAARQRKVADQFGTRHRPARSGHQRHEPAITRP